MFVNNFWALVPPIIAIALALIFKEAYSALFIGVVIGALFVNEFAIVPTLDSMINDGMISAIKDNAGIFLFLVFLGIVVALVNLSGGSAAFGRWAKKNIKSKVGASIATFILGVLIFIDDYFNCLTVGSVMRPVTDSHKISRQKLAFLIDATAAPVCMIAPISSWAAAVSSTAQDLGTGMSGIELFIKAIPFNFYSILTLVFIIVISLMKFDYGEMAKYQLAAENGDLGASKASEDTEGNPNGKLVDLVFPVVVLIVFCTLGLLHSGGFFDAGSGAYHSLVGAFEETDAFVGLPWGGVIALVITVIYMIIRRTMTFRESMECVGKGFNAMVPPITILVLAVSLKNMTSALGAREFIGELMMGASQNLYSMLPAIIFLVACALAFATGTSWGTFGILIPVVTAMFPASSDILIIGISACLAGAVCGDHCSPISDTTIMASAGAQCEHLTHVKTQLPYAITVAAVSFFCFVIAGITQRFLTFKVNAAVCLVFGAAMIVAVLAVTKKNTAKQK